MTTHTLEDYLSRLQGVTQSGDGYKALCPAHDDRNPSLSIGPGKNGHPILYCHAGCSYDSIIAAMGLERSAPGPTSTARQIIATYDYRDESGALLYQKVRYAPKDFRIRRPDGNDGWDWSKGKSRPVLYRLPELLTAKVQGQTLFVGEGEKDADRLHSVGLTATTTIEGASEPGKRQKWQPEYSDQLEGPSRVVLLPDNDPPGKAHAEHIARQLAGKVADIHIVELPGLPAKGDVSDWLDAGHTVEELLRLVEMAETYRPDQAPAISNATEASVKDENLFSDYGNVVKLIKRLRERLAYTPGLGWLLYNPALGVWEPEPGSERVKRIVLETLREEWGSVLYAAEQDEADLKRQVKELDGDDPKVAMIGTRVKLASAHRDKVFAWIRQCETAYRIRSTMEIAEGYFWTRPESWDANPNILVCSNGVLDLGTGTLLPHAADYRATKTTGTDYCPQATHPAWDAVVALLKAEGDRYEFIHQYCGSGMHGANPCERVAIFQGDGGTGKGTLLTAIHRALGAYAETVEVGSLLATDWRRQNKSAPREDLLKLRGARFVYPSIEPPKDSKLDDGSIKALTGNDAITARYPYSRHSITFTPVFKLAIQTNFPLQTEFDDPGMKRRVIVIPFNRKPERPDPAIKDALMHDPAARAATLAWLYEGYRAWRNAGFALPESDLATKATAEYWSDMDPYAQFARDAGLHFDRRLKCLKPKLTGAFKAWRDETGRLDATAKGFPKWLKNMGCHEVQATTSERYWYGVDFIESSYNQNNRNNRQFQETPAQTFTIQKSTNKVPESDGYSGYSSYGNAESPAADDALVDFDEALGVQP